MSSEVDGHKDNEPKPAKYKAVQAWGGGDCWDVKLTENDETIRRGFASEAQAQSWIDSKMKQSD